MNRRNIGSGPGSGKGSGKRSGERSHKGFDKSPGKGSGKGSANAAEPPEPAASKTTKVVKGITMTWRTPLELSKATKRKESATREDPKAARATTNKRQEVSDKGSRGAENAAAAATSSGSHGPRDQRSTNNVRPLAWSSGDQSKRRRWSAGKKDGDGGSWETAACSDKWDKQHGDGDGH